MGASKQTTGAENLSDDAQTEAGVAAVTDQLPSTAKPTLHPSPGFGAWLRQTGGSLAFTTYQSARLFLISADDHGQTHGLERVVGAAMGLAVDAKGMWVCNKKQAWRFSNVGAVKLDGVAYDALYKPQRGYFLGPCDVHDTLADVSFRGDRYPLLFVNTNYSCIATLDDFYNFRPLWKPDFISAIAYGDRCHLNGMCAREGELAFVTLCGQSDTTLGWKPLKNGGGCVIDIAANRIVGTGLSMPHSPRWHQGRLWLLNSGDGEFGYLDFASGRFIAIARCPGFARGLNFVGDYAVIGVSKLRDNTFSSGLSIAAYLESQHIRQTCGLLVIDIRSGALVHWLSIEGVVTELYDVDFLPGVTRPYTPGFIEPQSDADPDQGEKAALAYVVIPDAGQERG